MPKRSTETEAEALEREICTAVGVLQRETSRRYVTVADVQARTKTSWPVLEAAIELSCKRGWLNCAGRPAHTVELTRTGKEAMASAARLRAGSAPAVGEGDRRPRGRKVR